jgi:tetratricopeptide (TPR) repeat protein
MGPVEGMKGLWGYFRPASVQPGLILFLLVLLLGSSFQPIRQQVLGAQGRRNLLLAIHSDPNQSGYLPFPCAAQPLTSSESIHNTRRALSVLASLKQAQPGKDFNHLIGTALCLLDDKQAALELYLRNQADPYSLVQRGVLDSLAGRAEAGVSELMQADLPAQDYRLIISTLASSPEPDLRLLLQELANRFPGESQIWHEWLKVGEQLGEQEQWAMALEWYQQGAQLQVHHQQCVRCATLYIRAGRLLQTRPELRDLQKALEQYELAIAASEELNTTEKSLAHLYRGEVYLALQDQYGALDALAEFELALALDPQSYWAFINIGRLYMIQLENFERAESYFQDALVINPNTPYTYLMFGDLYRLREELAQAESWYRQALTRQPDYQPALDRLQALGANP